jgi:hypothetical protein
MVPYLPRDIGLGRGEQQIPLSWRIGQEIFQQVRQRMRIG